MTTAPASAAERGPAPRLGDHLALDFLNTLATPHDEPVEWLANGRDLLDWLEDAGVLERAERARIESSSKPAALNTAAKEAAALREWFRGALERAKAGAALSKRDAERLNAVLARGASVTRIALTPEGARLETAQTWSNPAELLVPIARAMAELLCEGELDLVRRCEGPRCTLWFYDRTKAHRRRWCSQAVCGNRAKVAAYRARHRDS